MKKNDISIYINRAKLLYGDKYGYDNFNASNIKEKGFITCKEHGDFLMNMDNHLNSKQGCPKCGGTYKYTNDEYISAAIKKYGDKYDYSKTKYIDSKTLITVTCHQLDKFGIEHGDFNVKPSAHLTVGSGCPKCAQKYKMTTDEFIIRAKMVHGDKYDYSKTKYINSQTKVTIIHKEYGEFEQLPYNHLKGCGHPSEKKEKMLKTKTDKKQYKYKAIDELILFLSGIIGIEKLEINNKNIFDGDIIDIFIPSFNIGIIYNDLSYYANKEKQKRKYHLNKTLLANKKGIKLIQVFEDEYIEHKDIILSKIKHILKLNNDSIVIGARKCVIQSIDIDMARKFLNINHMQGFGKSTFYYGAFYKEKLIAVMSFLRNSEKYFELTRFATDNNYRCPGLGNKMFKYFINTNDIIEVKSFADRRWTIDVDNNLYTKLGFKLDKILLPEYRYVTKDIPHRYHKFNFRKKILNKKYGLSLDMTENEMTKKLGYYKIFDCGLLKYIYKLK